MQDMFFRLIFSLGSLFFMILLQVSYLSKGFNLKLRNRLYVFFMSVCLSVVFTEILTYFYFSFGNSQIIYYILSRLQCLSILLWGFSLLCYCNILIFKPEVDNFKDYLLGSKVLKGYSIFTIILFIIILFIPCPSIIEREITFLPNYSLPCIIHYNIAAFIIFVMMLYKIHDLSFKDKFIICILVFEVPIFAFLQNILPPVAFLSLCNTIQAYIIYFYYENPDLFMIEEITKLTEETEKISKIKSEFLSNMSHEIRSPMNAIMGFSETILNDSEFDKERVVNDISIIESSSKNLLEIINNILDISKIESNQDTLEEKDYSFSKILTDLKAIIETRIANKPIKLIFNVEEGIPDKLHGDSTKIFQVLLNILTNAAKYTEVGKIVLDVSKEIVDNKILLSIKVADTGYGIKKEDYNKMFEKFSRLDEATTNEIEGTGLGLVITKRYVNLMQGKIWFESEYGVGTTFFVDLPQIICANQDAVLEEDKEDELEQTARLADLSRFKVLIVDDNKLNIKVAQRIIEGYGIQVETSTSGKDCIFKFKEGNHYDMIFMDHMMPEMDGIETFHILRKLEGYYQPPIIALTANAVAGARDMYINEGFDDYLSKPIDQKELERIFDKFFINRH